MNAEYLHKDNFDSWISKDKKKYFFCYTEKEKVYDVVVNAENNTKEFFVDGNPSKKSKQHNIIINFFTNVLKSLE